MRALALVLLMATPAAAQDGGDLAFDGGLVTACLDRIQSATTGTDMPDFASCIGAASGPCIESPGGYSTVGMSSCLGQEYDVWDGLLNDSYGRVMAAAKATDAEMAGMGSSADPMEPALKQMQRDWIAFRDSACAYEATRWGGGTGGGPASVDCMLQLTARQYLRLRAYEPRADQ